MTRSGPWLTALLQTVILLTVVACATPWLDAAESSLPTPRRSGDITLRGFQARPIFNGSVVPGGVYSSGELRVAIERDAIVAHHYRDVRLDEMSAVTLTAGRAAYVSYRRGDRVYWTRERVWLEAGETVLTDGTTTIRARCGNCVSEVKQDDVAAVEPAHGELDDFVVPLAPDSGVDPLAAAAEAELSDLLQVPFAPQTIALFGLGDAVADLVDDAFGESGVPFLQPPLMLPTGGAGTGSGGERTGGGGGTGGVPPVPPTFVPPGGGTGPGGGTTSGSPETTTGDFTPGSPTTGSATTDTLTTGTPSTDTLTTGSPADTTSVSSTGTATGSPTTDTNGGPTSGATPAPEPGVLWLVTAGLIGLASRRARKR